MPVTLIHVSDTHGSLPTLPKNVGDVVVHSGDLMPNVSKETYYTSFKLFPELEIEFQREWIASQTETFKEWLDGRSLIYLPGNHDYYDDVCSILTSVGIDATDIKNRRFTFKDITFYGFPYVPWIGKVWNYSLEDDQMEQEVENLLPIFEEGLDILVTHAPLRNSLDLTRKSVNCGNSHLTNLLCYRVDKLPKWILHGHIHEANGWDEKMGIKISNAATTIHVLHV